MNRADRRRQAKEASKGIVAPQRIVLPSAPPASSPTIVANYADSGTLHRVGPMIEAVWSVPPALMASLVAAGRPIPAAVPGYFLIDTGATQTCMALAVANELGLSMIRYTDTLGAGGVTRHEVFYAHMAVSIPDSFGNILLVETDQAVAGLPDLDKSLNPQTVQNARAKVPVHVIGLLGRDFLRYTTMVYHGTSGIVELVLDTKTIPRATKTGPSAVGRPLIR